MCDIDNSIADGTERTKFAGPEPDRNYPDLHNEWLKKVQDDERLLADKPVPGMLFMVQRLAKVMTVVYLTARDEQHAVVTSKWLTKWRFPEGRLLMRPLGSRIDTVEFKEGSIKMLQSEKPGAKIIAIDDCPQALGALMYRSLDVLHLAPTWCYYNEDGEFNETYSEVMKGGK